jgi:hypothetical protein
LTEKVLLFHNADWYIAYVGLFQDLSGGDLSRPPVPAWYEHRTHAFICLHGEELHAVLLRDPSDKALNEYTTLVEQARSAHDVLATASSVAKRKGRRKGMRAAVVELHSIVERDGYVADSEIKRAIQMHWQSSDWGLMDCDRCRNQRGSLGHDHPCNECGHLKDLVREFRSTYKLPGPEK